MKKYLISAAIISLFVPSIGFSQDDAGEVIQSEGKARGDKKHHGPKGHRGKLAGKLLMRIDVDEDGQVSIDEYMAHAQQRFEEMDIDGNNFVTPEESKQAAEAMREKFREARSSLRKRIEDSGSE